jgi:hypothetical protein
MSRRVAAVLVAAVLGVGVGGAACASDSSSSDPTTTTSATCDDLARVQQDFDALKEADVVADGTEALTASLRSLRDSVSALADSATGDLADEAGSLRSSVDQLSTIIGSSGDQPVTSTLSQFTQQLQTIGSDVTALLDRAADDVSGCETAGTGGS